MHFLAPSDFHVRAHANVCVSVYPSVCWCGVALFVLVCVQVLMMRVSSDSQSTGLGSTSLTCQIRDKVVVWEMEEC